MKGFRIVHVALGALVLASSSHATLIANGDFENPYGAGNWTAFANGYRETVAFAHSGGSVGKLFGAFSGTSGIFQDFAASAGQSFVATGFGYNGSGDAMQANNASFLRVTFFDASNNELAGGANSAVIDVNTPQDAWTALSTGTVVAPTGTATGRVFMLFTQPAFNGGSAFFDDVAVNPVPEPATLLAIGGGLVGLARRRRR